MRTLLGWLEERGERAGITAGRSGAVVVAQRFGSALDLNLHFHALVLDGVYSSASPFSRPVFRPAAPLTDPDVVELSTRLHRRILRYLTRCARLPTAEHDEAEPQPNEPLLAELYAAYARTVGFHVDACTPREPQQKGKTEAKVRLCRALFALLGARFNGLQHLQHESRSARRALERARDLPGYGQDRARELGGGAGSSAAAPDPARAIRRLRAAPGRP